MYMELYQVAESHNTINKEKVLVTSMNISFKKQTNILRPYIKIYYPNGVEMFNYAYIEELGRYYFITNVEPYPNDIYYLQFEVDVLESYKIDILESRKVDFIQKVEPVINILESVNGVKPETSYVLSTVAKTDDIDIDKDIDVTE